MRTICWRSWHVTLIILLFSTGLFLSGCHRSDLPMEAVPSLGTAVQKPEQPAPANEGTNEESQSPLPEPSDQANGLPSEPKAESDPGKVSEPPPPPPVAVPPKAPNTPTRPFYGLDGTPPSAPGLEMKARVFDSEPEKIAYLTFDDGPYPQTTPRILELLKKEDVKATFFVLGSQVARYPDLLKAEYGQGEGIGNHSYSHDYNSVYRSPEAFLAEIKQAEDIIYNTIGVRPGIVRAPGGTQGHFNLSYYNALDAKDYLVYDWNVSSGDAAALLVPADQLISNIKSQVPGKSRVIILMHDAGVKTTTIDALPQIILFLKQQGYSFGVLTPKVAPILFPGGFKS